MGAISAVIRHGLGRLLLLAFLGWMTGGVGHAAAETNGAPVHRLALVIGNAGYHHVAALGNPANDARDFAKVLKQLGFEVIFRTDVSKNDMERVVGEFGDKLKPGDIGLFYYAGHGMQVEGRNYLVPVDATVSSQQRVKLEMVDVDVVLDQMALSKTKVSLVILDACRNNPFESNIRSTSGGLAQINAPEGTFIAYATAPGKVANDGNGENGLYTSELIKEIKAPGLSVEDVFKHVRVGVSRESNGEQVPWESSSLTGDFYFNPAQTEPPAALTDSADRRQWEAIKDSHERKDFDDFIASYPKSPFVELAQARIASIGVAQGEPDRTIVINQVAPTPPPPKPAVQNAAAVTAQPVPAPKAKIAVAPSHPPPAVAAKSSIDDIPPLECRTVTSGETVAGNQITHFGSECLQPDGSWRRIQ